MVTMPMAVLDQDWEGAGHAAAGSWLSLLGLATAVLAAVVVIALLARALLRDGRYRAVRTLSQGDRDALAEAVRAAEARTVGELVVVVVERSDRHPGAAWLAALSFLVLGSVLLAAFLPWGDPFALLSCQLGLGVLGYACARWLPDFTRAFVSEARAAEMAEEQAVQEFHAQALHRTEAATGVLLFVSLLERRVVVLADHGIAAVVPEETWDEVDRAVLDGVRAGSLRRGLEAAVRRTGDILAEHFPWREGDRDELPNHVVVRRE